MAEWQDQYVEKALRASYSFLAQRVEADVSEGIAHCESPIEVALFASMYHAAIETFTLYNLEITVGGSWWPDDARHDCLLFMPQAKVDQYRLDFLIHCRIGRFKAWLAVECDGHDFHEKSKEQARRDKERDRLLGLKGLSVFRFTGQEIYEDANACASQVMRMIQRKLEDSPQDAAHAA